MVLWYDLTTLLILSLFLDLSRTESILFFLVAYGYLYQQNPLESEPFKILDSHEFLNSKMLVIHPMQRLCRKVRIA